MVQLNGAGQLRLKNVVELKRSEIDWAGNWVSVKQSKTKKPLQVPISGKLKKVLKSIDVLPLGDHLFCDFNAKAVSTNVGRAFKKCGFKEHSFHSLRHFFACHACHAINSGVGLETVRDLLGHSDFRSTLIYARVKRDKLQQAVLEAFK